MRRLLSDTKGQALLETMLVDLVLLFGLVLAIAILSGSLKSAMENLDPMNHIEGLGSAKGKPFQPPSLPFPGNPFNPK